MNEVNNGGTEIAGSVTSPERSLHRLVGPKAWLSRWFDMCRCMMVSRAANPYARRTHVSHNGVTAALFAVGIRLKPGCGLLPKNAHVSYEPDWLKILKLLAKLAVLNLKFAYLARQQRKLLLKKVDYVLGQTHSADDASEFLCSVESAHDVDVQRPNENKISDAPGVARQMPKHLT